MARVEVQFGGKTGPVYPLETNEDMVVVRTREGGTIQDARLSGESRRLLDELEPTLRFTGPGVEVFHVRSGSKAIRDRARSVLGAESDVRFAGRVLSDPVYQPTVGIRATEPGAANAKDPVVYSENLFVKFSGKQKSAHVRRILASRKLEIARAVPYVPHAYFVKAPEGIGLEVFEIALDLLRNVEDVELCHPELLRRRQFRTAFPQQWHLKAARIGGVSIRAHANVVKAWKRSKGKGITIAVIDTGIDIDHEEFASKGKIVSPHDATWRAPDPDDPRPVYARDEQHGTCCAGVACADGRRGASGVAPAARLMPIRLMTGLGSQSEADAFAWIADHGADVISCSWGPNDGDWYEPGHAGHRAKVPLPDNARLAIEYAATKGRGGRGCVICWAAGNGNESVDNDGYASNPDVIAVAACNDRGTRSVYSDTGKALWCSFPSDDGKLEAFQNVPNPPPNGGVWNAAHPAPQTPGIWTTDWSGKHGYNHGGSTKHGDVAGKYANDFGGTSSSAPAVAGVAALVLSVNPKLTQPAVKNILRRACEQIDAANGQYDPNTGHSPLYGYGRVDAAEAVKLAAATLQSRSPRRKAKKRPAKRAKKAGGRRNA